MKGAYIMEKIRKPFDLKGRSLLKESDFTKEEFEGLIDFAMTLKRINNKAQSIII